ncbi:MAG TPA: hypothetical protein VNV85_02945 [Puia sp.]|jgi:hypothetical protein|nr:hypothetical protein [Puia sp.]
MKKTKKTLSKHTEHKSLLEIAGEKAEAIKEGFISGKDKVISVAEEKFDSVKKAIHEFTAPTHKKKSFPGANSKKTARKFANNEVKKAVPKK